MIDMLLDGFTPDMAYNIGGKGMNHDLFRVFQTDSARPQV